ncbi:uncharacterized protein ColSpa_11935 [Colletotrichum spaethianum]|uniref:Uncharacterized protein n=1 Tax=Colletotrichum spaethianum TaxID=700344 RepID=A0AA37PGE0_9PEZI|nr:uncharacterized protein ColSpa_11935 [Colletotrichum spaethianum]GKT51754.1 hypothetical protein ColSpa_11935 [Colletotrichum spaethianum]
MAANGTANLGNWIADSSDAVLKRNEPLHDWPALTVTLPFGTRASRLVASLARLGAVMDTKNESKAAQQRLAMEIQRLRYLLEYCWVDPNGPEADWAYRVKFWESQMKDFEFAPEEPAAFAAGSVLHSMALAMRCLHKEPGTGTLWKCVVAYVDDVKCL